MDQSNFAVGEIKPIHCSSDPILFKLENVSSVEEYAISSEPYSSIANPIQIAVFNGELFLLRHNNMDSQWINVVNRYVVPGEPLHLCQIYPMVFYYINIPYVTEEQCVYWYSLDRALENVRREVHVLLDEVGWDLEDTADVFDDELVGNERKVCVGGGSQVEVLDVVDIEAVDQMAVVAAGEVYLEVQAVLYLHTEDFFWGSEIP